MCVRTERGDRVRDRAFVGREPDRCEFCGRELKEGLRDAENCLAHQNHPELCPLELLQAGQQGASPTV